MPPKPVWAICPNSRPFTRRLTVQEYLTFAAELKGVKKAERKEQVCRAARRTGLETVLPRLIRSLSKGYKQRMGIATGLCMAVQAHHSGRATVGLDPAQVIEIRKLIRELGRRIRSSCPAISSVKCRQSASRS